LNGDYHYLLLLLLDEVRDYVKGSGVVSEPSGAGIRSPIIAGDPSSDWKINVTSSSSVIQNGSGEDCVAEHVF
jgi:hypothetical protein